MCDNVYDMTFMKKKALLANCYEIYHSHSNSNNY